MSFTNDQLGVNGRSVADIILYDKALTAHSVEVTTPLYHWGNAA
jgi:hypothetical protein